MMPLTNSPEEVSLAEFFEPFFPDYLEPIYIHAFKPRGAPEGIEFRPEKVIFTREQLDNDTSVYERLLHINRTRGLYFVVNAGGSCDNEIRRYNAFFAEIDDRPMVEQHRLFDHSPLRPSIRIETKKSVHAYWLQSGGCGEAEWRELQLRLIRFYRSDQKIKNPARVMRLPFFNHLTWLESGEIERVRVRLNEFNPGLRYTLSEMHRAFPAIEGGVQLGVIRGGGVAVEGKALAAASTATATAPGKTETEAPPARLFRSWEDLAVELRGSIMRHPSARMQADGWWHCRGICHDGRGDSAVCFNPATGAVKCMAGCDYRDVLVAFGLPDRPQDAFFHLSPLKDEERARAEGAERAHGDAEHEEGSPLIFSWASIKNRAFSDGERIVATLERGECGMLVSYPNVGKTSLCLNLALSLITGRSFPPLTHEGAAPRRVLILDAETSWARFQRDVWTMTKDFSKEEMDLVDDNLHVLCEGEIGGDAVQLSEAAHFRAVARRAVHIKPDLIIVDTMSQFFTLFDENSNAEVARKVWRPLQKLGRAASAAVLVLHHLPKQAESNGAPAVYAARGASASGGAARFLMQMAPARTDPTSIELRNTKSKGEPFSEIHLRLNKETRWFSPVPTRREQDSEEREDLVVNVLAETVSGAPLTASAVARRLEGMLSRASVYRYLGKLASDGTVHFDPSGGSYRLLHPPEGTL